MKKDDGQSERKWRERQVREFKAHRPRYQQYAEVLQEILQQAASQCAPLAIVQARAKTISSFAEKIQRKRDLYINAIKDITDLCGVRVITHTQTQVRDVCAFIKTHFSIDWDNSCDVSERLKPSEFGYLSVHYIVQFRPGAFPANGVDVSIPQALYPTDAHPMKAEIQVRTLLQHAWADISHELSYKSEIDLPRKWKREFAGLAAVLESADQAFCRLDGGLKTYRTSYGAYLTRAEMAEEIQKLEFVLKHDPENTELTGRVGKLAITCGDWDLAVDTLSRYLIRVYGSIPEAIKQLSEFKDTWYQPLLRDLGVALCKKFKSTPKGRNYRRGQRCLAVADSPHYRDSDALASLAGTWKGIDEDKVREYYKKAYEVDPADPYPLVNYLDCELAAQRSTAIANLLMPVVDSAMQKCRDHVEVGMNLPWAFYNLGKFNLLLKKPYESVRAYSKAIQLSTAPYMIESAVDSMEKLAVVKGDLPGYEWIMKLLLCGTTARFPTQISRARLKRLRELASRNRDPIQGPVVIVAGGCDPRMEESLRQYRTLLLTAFRYFRGTVISGGTTSGISGLTGEVQQTYGSDIQTLGYLPSSLPRDGKRDARYADIRRTSGKGEFTPLEPIQSWIDILAAGIAPSDVKVLGINGGRIAATEYRIALALGATVAIIEESGREAARLLQDDDWRTFENLLVIPADPMTVRAFVGPGNAGLPADIRDTIAKGIHEEYRRNQSKAPQKTLSMAEWPELPETLRNSNLQQADDIFGKLAQIGCTVHPVRKGTANLLRLKAKEVETLAEMEHARWNVERLKDGWHWGPEKDVDAKLSPYLVSWQDLPEDVRKWDRQAVRAIPKLLTDVELEIRREPN